MAMTMATSPLRSDGEGMAPVVIELQIIAPERRAAGNGKKPLHRIVLSLDEGQDRLVLLPARAARLFQKEQPELPLPLDEVLSRIRSVEERACMAELTDMVSRREHSVFELRQKLERCGYHSRAIDCAIERATEYRYVDDLRFAHVFIDERCRRGWGRRRIELELSRAGIEVSELPDYPDAYYPVEGELERARAALARKTVPEVHAFERLTRFLLQRGFSYEVASTAVRERLAEPVSER